MDAGCGAFEIIIVLTVCHFARSDSTDNIRIPAPAFRGKKRITAGLFITNRDSEGVAFLVFVINALGSFAIDHHGHGFCHKNLLGWLKTLLQIKSRIKGRYTRFYSANRKRRLISKRQFACHYTVNKMEKCQNN